jgi:hypothetical protein
MALLKLVKTEFGIDAIYWNIVVIQQEFKSQVVEVKMAGYVNKEMRDKNLTPVAWKNLTFTGFDYIKDATREAVYLALKAKDFADAEDA